MQHINLLRTCCRGLYSTGDPAVCFSFANFITSALFSQLRLHFLFIFFNANSPSTSLPLSLSGVHHALCSPTPPSHPPTCCSFWNLWISEHHFLDFPPPQGHILIPALLFFHLISSLLSESARQDVRWQCWAPWRLGGAVVLGAGGAAAAAVQWPVCVCVCVGVMEGFWVEVEHSRSALFQIQYYTWPQETQGNTFFSLEKREVELSVSLRDFLAWMFLIPQGPMLLKYPPIPLPLIRLHCVKTNTVELVRVEYIKPRI